MQPKLYLMPEDVTDEETELGLKTQLHQLHMIQGSFNSTRHPYQFHVFKTTINNTLTFPEVPIGLHSCVLVIFANKGEHDLSDVKHLPKKISPFL